MSVLNLNMKIWAQQWSGYDVGLDLDIGAELTVGAFSEECRELENGQVIEMTQIRK